MTLPTLLALHYAGMPQRKRSPQSDEVTALAVTGFEARASSWAIVAGLHRDLTSFCKQARANIAGRIPSRGNKVPAVPRPKAERLEWLRLQDRSAMELERALGELGDPVSYLQHTAKAAAARRSFAVYRAARAALVERNLPACRMIAARWCGIYGRSPTASIPVSRDDLVQEAVIGLLRAIDLFDPSKECAFSTYCYPWVEQAVRRTVLRHATVRPPIAMRDENGHVPRSICMSTDARANFGTGDAPSSRRPAIDVLLEDDALAEAQDLEQHRHLQGLWRRYDAVADQLPEKERQVLGRRLGGESLETIGQKLGCTREWVRQIESKAKTRIRDLIERQTHDDDRNRDH